MFENPYKARLFSIFKVASFLSTRARKKHICNADVLFSTKFALWASEIASL